MKTLTTVLGPAPSELSIENFHTRLLIERDRVKQALADYREKVRVKRSAPKKTPKPKGKKAKALKFSKNLSDALGISQEELLERMKELAEKEE